MKGFGSDNHSGVHPQILEALIQANQEHAPSYGTDAWTEKAQTIFKKHFGNQIESHFVFNGTAANVLSVKASLNSFNSVIVSDVSHMNLDECGAPEFIAGCKLIPIKSINGKINLADLETSLVRKGDQHHSQIKMLSLTQPTELGTCYSLEEIKDLTSWAHKNKILVHIDGSRLANAAFFLNCNLKELTADCGVDVLSLGGTKNGFMFGEAVVFFNLALSDNFKYIRKQCLQLPSKTRFIACQFVATLENDLWKQIAKHSCEMAEKLKIALEEFSEIELMAPVQSNAVFVKIPKEWTKILKQKYFFYVWDETTWCCRLMTSWDTSLEDIQDFASEIRKLSNSKKDLNP